MINVGKPKAIDQPAGDSVCKAISICGDFLGMFEIIHILVLHSVNFTPNTWFLLMSIIPLQKSWLVKRTGFQDGLGWWFFFPQDDKG